MKCESLVLWKKTQARILKDPFPQNGIEEWIYHWNRDILSMFTFDPQKHQVSVKVWQYEYTHDKIQLVKSFWKDTKENIKLPARKATQDDVKTVEAEINLGSEMQCQYRRPVYLAILGRVYNVDKGKKHYGKGGGYHFFAGIRDWVSFYEKDYKLVGVLIGRYYDSNGNPTKELKDVLARMQTAAEWKQSKAAEAEVFPPCNSEWHQNSGGRVWCSMKSGGIQRDWAGVPRLLYDPNTKQQRCACVKNFGPGLSSYGAKGNNRGDLDHPNLRQYPKCSPTANSCRLEND
ncbi:hypothetical protein NECAME_15664 [Necator americanus]|uniref:Cytochrome b5-like Heme/Steroid binding domain protein n=1 Tax=Necator americanus TaxID=51031 RepID=W2SIN0_NECAM|nr:hypothetical protein NECAME_15664 [Necator americanus]ETN68726.1 hypothetical protein NECAME_15664 [Necator americanus]